MAADRSVIASEQQPLDNRWSAYPTRTLRALLVCETVRQLPAKGREAKLFKQTADALQNAWVSTYPERAMQTFEPDVGKVVTALLRTRFAIFATAGKRAGAPLTDVITFSGAMEEAARRDAAEANTRNSLRGEDIRALFAGVALAFLGDPERFFSAQAQARFRQQLDSRRGRGVRGVEVKGFIPAAPAERDRATAEALARAFAARDRT